MSKSMNELFGLVFLFAVVGIVIFFSAGILASQDAEADTGNMSEPLLHAYNVTGDSVEASLTVGSFMPLIIGAIFTACL